MKLSYVLPAALLIFATPSFAFSYIETSDLPDDVGVANGFDLGIASIGQNTFSGSLSGNCVFQINSFGCSGDRVDNVSFTVPQSAVLKHVSVAVDGFYPNMPQLVGFVWNGGGNRNFFTTFPIGDTRSEIEILPGRSFAAILGQTITTGPGPFRVNYVTTLTVEAVPEPSTWLTLLMGFAALGGMVRRRVAKALLPS